MKTKSAYCSLVAAGIGIEETTRPHKSFGSEGEQVVKEKVVKNSVNILRSPSFLICRVLCMFYMVAFAFIAITLTLASPSNKITIIFVEGRWN